jgi:hypothetical protein
MKGIVAMVVLACLWIVAIWTSWPGGPLHENYKVKIFWTVISAFVLLIAVSAYVSERKRTDGR